MSYKNYTNHHFKSCKEDCSCRPLSSDWSQLALDLSLFSCEIGLIIMAKLKAKYLIENAAEVCCKISHRSEILYNTSDINSYDLGTQYIISEIKE